MHDRYNSDAMVIKIISKTKQYNYVYTTAYKVMNRN